MKKGFTLIELLVVIAIIGLLSTLAVAALNDSNNKQKCDEGDKEACKLISIDLKEENCTKDFTSCNYQCATNAESDLIDCTARCEIKKDYCKNN